MDNNNIVGNYFIERLSGGNHELFHSNLLAYLAQYQPKFFAKVFDQFLPPNVKFDHVETEKKLPAIKVDGETKISNKLDLYITLKQEKEEDTVFVLENKMKSLPSKEQLNRYSSAINKKNSKFILLSLLKPAFSFEQNETEWEFLSYKSLAKKLEENLKYLTSPKLKYLASFLKDYISYIRKIDSIVNEAHDYITNPELTLNMLDTVSENEFQKWFKKLAINERYRACAEHLKELCKIPGLDCQAILHHRSPEFEVLLPLCPDEQNGEGTEEECEEYIKKHKPRFFVHLQNKRIKSGFRFYGDECDKYRSCNVKLNNNKAERDEFLVNNWKTIIETTLGRKLCENLNKTGLNLEKYCNTGRKNGYVFEDYAMPYVTRTGIKDDTKLSDVFAIMQKEIETVYNICNTKEN